MGWPMRLITRGVLAVLLTMGGGALACPVTEPKVALRYTVDEQTPERVEARITNPVEKLLAGLPRLADMVSTTGHGVASFQLRFDGGASADDLAAVRRRIDGWRPAGGIALISTDIVLTTACLITWPWDDPAAPTGQGARAGKE